MKTITLLAVAVMLLLEIFGPTSSVGCSMTFVLAFVAVILAVAIYEAWSNRRGAIGWIVNVLVCTFGALVAIALVGMAMDIGLPYPHLEGSLASLQHPLKYAVVAAVALLIVLGSWIPLRIINRVRGQSGLPEG